MKEYILLFLKGIGMGVANVIPGVSGGTIALITRIYEELIESIKSLDINAIRLLTSLRIKEFLVYTNFYFLVTVFMGSIVSLFSIASVLKYLFLNYPIFIWAFFFGLILASVYFVGQRITKWTISNILLLIIGTIIAISISFFTPANENENLFFVFICGIVGISGMILPGLSGSFILILMGNYELLMVEAITELNYLLLSVFCIGSVFGLISFSHVLAWLFRKYKDSTLSILTGFILGSLSIIWPWKKVTESIIINGKEKILKYNWCLPDMNMHTVIAILLIIIGIIIVWGLENFSSKKGE